MVSLVGKSSSLPLSAQPQDIAATAPSREAADGWQAHRPALHSAILTDNADTVNQVLAPLSVAQRALLVNSPLVDGGAGPRLPLCLAGQRGSVAVMQTLLKAPGALPYLGETSDDEVTTALYWAATVGACDVMSMLHDGCSGPRGQVLMATQEGAPPEVLTWWREHGLSPSELLPSLQAAVNADEPTQVDELVRLGGVDPNSASSQGGTLLQSAIRAGNVDTAGKLLDCGATATAPDGEQPLALAVRNGQAALAVRLVRLGAPADIDTLRLALEHEDEGARLYAMLAGAGVVPTTVADAADLQRLAELKQASGLLQLITLQANRLAQVAALEPKKGTEVPNSPLLTWIDGNVKVLIKELSQPNSPLGLSAPLSVKAVAIGAAVAAAPKSQARRATHKVLKRLHLTGSSKASPVKKDATVSAEDALALVPRKR